MRRILLLLPFLGLVGCDASGPAPADAAADAPAATLLLQIADGGHAERIDLGAGTTSRAEAAVQEWPDGSVLLLQLAVVSAEGAVERRGQVTAIIPLPDRSLEAGDFSAEGVNIGGLQYVEERGAVREGYRFELVRVLLAVERVGEGAVVGRYSLEAAEGEGARRAVATGTFEASLDS